MSHVVVNRRSRSRLFFKRAVLCLTAVLVAKVATVWANEPQQTDPQTAATPNRVHSELNTTHGEMMHMSGHMHMTALRPSNAGDQQKADALVVSVKAAMAPYQDYRKALSDGYKIFLPDVAQSQYHFTNYKYGLEASVHFDPLKPTSLLYTNVGDGYKLVGAMYTDRVGATEDELNERVPLSIARWHQHINFCKAPMGQRAAYFGPNAKFGLRGSITTEEACETAGGEFHPHLFGWMVHVYPYETDPKNIWSTHDDDQGHDNMDHSATPGMTMD